MFKRMFVLIVAVICVILQSNSYGALFGSGDLLNGIGDFETAADRAAWRLHTWSGDSTLNKFDSELPHTGSWSWHMGPSTGYGNTWGGWTASKFSTVANREHRFIVYARSQVSTPSWINYVIGGSGWQPLSYYTTVWGYNEKYYTSGATEETMEVAFKMHANSANDNGYIDDVIVNREVALPDVTAYTGAGGQWTLSNTGGRIGVDDQLIAYDPDVVVSYAGGFDVGQITATYNSDNKLVIDFQNALMGSVDLLVTNPYGDSAVLVTVPEPATISIFIAGGLLCLKKRRK